MDKMFSDLHYMEANSANDDDVLYDGTMPPD